MNRRNHHPHQPRSPACSTPAESEVPAASRRAWLQRGVVGSLTLDQGLAQAAVMAREVIEQLVDDLDGSEAAESVSFGLDGVTFEIDLNGRHADELREALRAYVRAGRRVGGRSGGGVRSARSGGNRDRNAAIRGWALDNGIELPGRGRIARGVQDAYDAGDVPALYAATGLDMDG
jgi:hypothetical protein